MKKRNNLKDYTGLICGCWMVVSRDQHPTSKSHETFWKCKCLNCGSESSVRKSDLDKKPHSCNNCKGKIISELKTKYKINVGDTFGYLKIIEQPRKENNNKALYVKCECQCGRIIQVRKDHLFRKGNPTISCGCASRSAGQVKLEQICQENKWEYQMEYRIKDFNLLSPFDCAIFKNNKLFCLIEYDGQQHFNAINFFGGEQQLQLQRQRDKNKEQWCKNNNIILLRIPYTDYDILNTQYLFLKIPKLKELVF